MESNHRKLLLQSSKAPNSLSLSAYVERGNCTHSRAVTGNDDKHYTTQAHVRSGIRTHGEAVTVPHFEPLNYSDSVEAFVNPVASNRPLCSQTPVGRNPTLDDFRRGWLLHDYFPRER